MLEGSISLGSRRRVSRSNPGRGARPEGPFCRPVRRTLLLDSCSIPAVPTPGKRTTVGCRLLVIVSADWTDSRSLVAVVARLCSRPPKPDRDRSGCPFLAPRLGALGLILHLGDNKGQIGDTRG